MQQDPPVVNEDLTPEEMAMAQEEIARPPAEADGGFYYEDLTDEQKEDLKKKVEENKKVREMTRADLYRAVTSAMDGQFMAKPWKAFKCNFKVMRDEKGEYACFEADKDQVLKMVSKERIRNRIVDYIKSCPHVTMFPTRQVVDEIFEFWQRATTALTPDEVKNVRQLSKPGYTYRRLPWDLRDGPTPLFDEMMRRTTNAQALQDYIGSLFFDEADRQTYLWIFGRGGDGKGSLLRVLQKVFGNAFASENTQFINNFWLSALMQKRVVVFPDCEDHKFVTTGLFKSMTGNDMLRMERKGEMPFSAQLIALFIFLSNERPSLSLQEADMRRVIFSHMSPPTERFLHYERNLWNEAQHFLWKCIRGYRQRYPDFTAIQADRTEVLDLAEHHQEYNQMIFDKFFEHKGIKEGAADRQQPHVTANRVQSIMVFMKMTPPERRGFVKFLRDVKGYENKVIRLDSGETERRWLGFEHDHEGMKNVVDITQGRM